MPVKSDTRTDLTSLRAEYREIFPIAERLSEELEQQLKWIVLSCGIQLGFQIQRRVKTWDSIASKTERLSRRFKKISDMQDIVGIRIVSLFRRDSLKICDLISKNFEIIRKYDTQERLDTDQFGYSSIHFIVKFPDEWLKLPSMNELGRLNAEIQIRTLAQHTWAEASRLLQYKKEEIVPPPLLRSIYRVSALLELVDLEFERVLVDRDVYRSQDWDKGEKLNVDSLGDILDASLPRANRRIDEPYAAILQDLNYFEINIVRDLELIIEEQLDNAIAEDKRYVKHLSVGMSENTEEIRDDDIINIIQGLKKGVYLGHAGLVREMLNSAFGEKYRSYREY